MLNVCFNMIWVNLSDDLHILQLKFVKTVEALVLNGKRKNDNKFSGYTKHSMVHKHYNGGYRW